MRPPDRRYWPGAATLGAIVAAFAVANSPLRPLYEVLHHLPVALRIGDLGVSRPLILWVNDGLMVFFFLLIGLELKRELLEGYLASAAARSGPVVAALGGMAVPALIYVAFNPTGPAVRGWPVPAATDIVLVVTLLTLAGSRVPLPVKVFVTALATLDDLAAIAIIALYFAADLSVPALAVVGTTVAALALLNAAGVTRTAAYVVAGAVLWIALSRSGVHATLAGVLVGFAIPMRGASSDPSSSPLRRMETGLGPCIAFGVVPLFAFLNSGIPLTRSALVGLGSPVSLGIGLGLFLGKQAGIVGATWLAVRTRLTHLPAGATWAHMYGVGLVSGVGFTMSVFIAGLAFPDPTAFLEARLSVIVGSALSAVAGLLFLRATTVPAPGAAASNLDERGLIP